MGVTLSLFDSYQVVVSERGLVKLDSDKTRALLAYLAIEANRPHTRKKLAALLWPDSDAPRANLSQALYVLRRLLEVPAGTTPLFLADSQQVQLNPVFDLYVDLCDFQRLRQGCDPHHPTPQADCPACIEQLSQAEALTHGLATGEFLSDLSFEQCDDFEDWCLTTRAQLQRELTETRAWLAEAYRQQGDIHRARKYAQPLLDHDSLHELGQPLSLPLGILHQQGATLQPPSQPVLFVGRERERDSLQQALLRVLQGEGHMIFVTGEAGFGKTLLLRHVAEQMRQQHPQIVVASGNCNAHTGVGDPYLPFREILASLTGDVERQVRAATIDPTHASQLQQLAPQTLQALASLAADLIGSFLPSDALLTRLAALKQEGAAWVTRLRNLITQYDKNRSNPPTRQQAALFEQYSALLLAIAAQHPLVLILDDLQWADLGTINLLFHLARKLNGARILLIGAYRPSDVAAGRNGHRHPLEPVLHEIQRLYGEVDLSLDAADGRSFVNALIDALIEREANDLSPHFRQRVHHYTQGNALFTIELLRGMQDRGDLVRNAAGRWVESTTLDWDRLPPRIEAVIAERIGRLPPELCETLELASVEGESFTLEVLADLLQVDRRQVVRWLGSELDRQHQLVQVQDIAQLAGQTGGQVITRYRFRHILFQKYLYDRLDAAQRLIAHADVAARLETLYANHAEAQEEIAGQLAWHYEAARQWMKAAAWLLVSGQRALRLSALDDAIVACQKAIAFLEKRSENEEQQRLELDLQIIIGNAFVMKEGYTSRSAMQCYERAEVLSLKLGEMDKLIAALSGLSSTSRINAYLERAKEIGERMVRLAEAQPIHRLRADAHAQLATTLVHIGQLVEAHAHFECAKTYISNDGYVTYSPNVAHDAFVLAHNYHPLALCSLGFLDQAQAYAEFVIEATLHTDQPNSHAFALFSSLLVYLMRRDAQRAAMSVTQLRAYAAQHESIHFWIVWLQPHLAWIAFEQGNLAHGLELLYQWLPPARFGERTVSPLSWQFTMLLVAQCKAGQIEEGLTLPEKVLQLNNRLSEHWWTAEIYRLKGALLLRRPNAELDPSGEAERAFQRAIQIAQPQQAKLWELRAATHLAQLWHKQGQTSEGYELLKPVYDWFTEGFETYDLQKAKTLLETFS